MPFACLQSIPKAVDEGRGGYLQQIGLFIALFVGVHLLAEFGARFSVLLASRKTVLGGTLHGVGTSWMAMLIVGGVIDLSWWPAVGLPFSIAYLITDIVFYCWPKRDVVIFVHHLIMMFSHFTTGTTSGALICGAGDVKWAQWVSVVGYLSEIPNPFLNSRWYMLKTLKKNHVIFTVNNSILLVTWIVGRLIVLPSNLLLIVPRFSDFAANGGYDCFAVLLIGHVIIVLLSIDWLLKLLRGGIQDFFVFNPKAEIFNPNSVSDAVKKAT